jgi:hypothetical protein
LFSLFVFGAATAALVMINYEVNASLAAFAPQNASSRIPKEKLHDSRTHASDLRFRLCANALRNRGWCPASIGSLQ